MVTVYSSVRPGRVKRTVWAGRGRWSRWGVREAPPYSPALSPTPVAERGKNRGLCRRGEIRECQW